MAARKTTTRKRQAEKPEESPEPADPRQPDDSTVESDLDTRRERIAAAAYYKAERRNFEGGSELDDWLEAEREIDTLAAAGGIRAEASKRSEGPHDVSGTGIKRTPSGADGEERIEPADVKRWAASLAVPAVSLRTAIERVGPRVEDVKRYLEQHQARK